MKLPVLVQLSLLFILCTCTNSITWDYLKEGTMLSYASYCQPNDIQRWNCYWCNQTKQRVQVTNIFENSKTNTFGFAGYKGKTIIVSFRGTQVESLENWIQNLRFAKRTTHPNITNATVHKGFLEAYHSIRNQFIPAIQKLAQRGYDKIYITGHSLGGALGILAAIDIHYSLKLKHFEMLTFGQPRIGDLAFAQFVNTTFPTIHRVTNQNDIVPRLPPSLVLNYRHPPREVFFPNNTKEFIMCDFSGEDPKCCNSRWLPGIFDHFKYLGFDKRDGKGYNC